jgi:hypothetical protein
LILIKQSDGVFVSAKTIINEVKRLCHEGFWDSSTEEEKRDTGMTGLAGLPAYLGEHGDGFIGADRASSSGETAGLDGCAYSIILRRC